MGTWAQVTCRVTTTRPDFHRMRIALRGSFGAGPRYLYITSLGCKLFHLFTLRTPGLGKDNGLLVGGEPNHISEGVLSLGLVEVTFRFNA